MCWFEAGVTDPFGSRLAPLRDGLGFLKSPFCPHYEREQMRRPALHHELQRGFPPAMAADDGVGLHFVGTQLTETDSSRPEAPAYRVHWDDVKVIEDPIATRDTSVRENKHRCWTDLSGHVSDRVKSPLEDRLRLPPRALRARSHL
jgi:hypothetical protein